MRIDYSRDGETVFQKKKERGEYDGPLVQYFCLIFILISENRGSNGEKNEDRKSNCMTDEHWRSIRVRRMK